MDKAGAVVRRICNTIILIGFLYDPFSAVFAATPDAAAAASVIKNFLPGSTQPGVVSRTLTEQEPVAPASQPSLKTEAPAPSGGSLGPEAAKIKFKLTKIELEGNHVYSNQQIEQLYKNKINTEISIIELQEIVQSITNYYRNNGYVLSRAILPPQRVQAGIVKVRVIEGFVDHVKVIGVPRGSRKLIQAYGDQIARSRPLQIKVMEYYLRLANEVPGLQVKAVLEPAKEEVGASDLNLTSEQQTYGAYASYDNYGTRYIGPQQTAVGGNLNSIFRPGDITSLNLAADSRVHELKFYDASYATYVGANGLNLKLGKNQSETQPQFVLAPLEIKGKAVTYYGSFQYPLIRARDKNMTLSGGFNYLDTQVTSFGFPLYTDHLRPIQVGLSYDFADKYKGSNLANVTVYQGLNLMGASNNSHATTTSRFGGVGVFTKFTLQAMRLQQLFSRYSLYFLVNGQYTFQPLLSSQQVTYGGSQLGRGYDSAEIIGDQGLGGTLELRANYAPSKYLLQSFQLYVFYDAAQIWNRKFNLGVPMKQSITSTGIGSRFFFTKNLSGNLMWTQPLTKKVAAEELIGEGTTPRIFFSIVASV